MDGASQIESVDNAENPRHGEGESKWIQPPWKQQKRLRKGAFFGLLLFLFLGKLGVTRLELVDPAGSIHELHFAGEERM